MQDYKRSADKQRLFNDFNAGCIRILIGSSDTTGVNVQPRLKALHHLDVPWLPSQIEQREGRIERQGNQHNEIKIYAYATLGSMDATLWQNNERKARFIAAALAGDRGIRTIEDIGEAANQFALAKAIASGDPRLLQKAGLEADIARLERQRAAHFDDQLNIRKRIHTARQEQESATRRAAHIRIDLQQRKVTRGDAFEISLEDRIITDRRTAGTLLLSKVRLAQRAGRLMEAELGTLGGFRIAVAVYRGTRPPLEAALILRRTEYDQHIPIELNLTPMGLISRLEHMLDRFELDLETELRRAREAAIRLADYQERSVIRSPSRPSSTSGRPNSPHLTPTSPRVAGRRPERTPNPVNPGDNHADRIRHERPAAPAFQRRRLHRDQMGQCRDQGKVRQRGRVAGLVEIGVAWFLRRGSS
jgi:Helicase conserved C-terminal domain